jgi:tripartite-type tricarboxylate transporter receptor subunit TctC
MIHWPSSQNCAVIASPNVNVFMEPIVRSILLICTALWTCLPGASVALAQNSNQASSYPTRPVSVVIPFPAGGSSDTVLRLIGQIVSKEWNQPIVIDNRVGATGAIAGEYVVRQPADGYTLLNAAPTSHTALRALRRDLPYDPLTDLVPVTMLVSAPMMLVVNPKKVPVHSVKELIDYAKANPDKISYASTGIGSVAHLSVELFKLSTGTEMVHVPYRGNAPAMNDLLAGNVDLTIDVSSSVNAHLQSGAIRALAATTPKRSALFPDMPTVAETVPGFEAFSWNGIVVRAGVPAPVMEKVRADFGRAVRQPEVMKLLSSMLMEPVGSSPAEFAELIKADHARWQRVVQAIKIDPSRK